MLCWGRGDGSKLSDSIVAGASCGIDSKGEASFPSGCEKKTPVLSFWSWVDTQPPSSTLALSILSAAWAEKAVDRW